PTWYSPTYTSPRPASRIAVTISSSWPCVTASASSIETAASGLPSTSQSAFTVDNPTRSPVNDPGPSTTTSPSSCDFVKGVSFMEDQAGWHGKTPNYEELLRGLQELALFDRIPVQHLLDKAQHYQAEVDRKLEAKMPKFTRNYWWNAGDTMKVKMEPTRKGFGQSLAENGDDERVVCLGLDISGSIMISDFYAGKPDRKKRWISMGIAEQSATSAAAGLAREGKLPVLGTYATFAAARNLDQIRTSVCYGNFNVMI